MSSLYSKVRVTYHTNAIQSSPSIPSDAPYHLHPLAWHGLASDLAQLAASNHIIRSGEWGVRDESGTRDCFTMSFPCCSALFCVALRCVVLCCVVLLVCPRRLEQGREAAL
jgi:hypothetical protein